MANYRHEPRHVQGEARLAQFIAPTIWCIWTMEPMTVQLRDTEHERGDHSSPLDVSCLSNKPPCSSGEVVPAGGGGGGGVSVQEGCCVVLGVTPCTETTRIPVTLKNADLPTNKDLLSTRRLARVPQQQSRELSSVLNSPETEIHIAPSCAWVAPDSSHS
ncbi:hypothetical protein NQZ68_034383 [Dissostichus eleginoides]|nr:hypothetical protein NQZ68_034383 [Dissostichus eleginoides]